MRILNTKDPEDVVKLIPWLIPTESETRMEIAAELYRGLKDRPRDVLVLVAIERDIARAVLIAHISHRSHKRVWLWQAQAEPGFRYSRILFEGLKAWSRACGAREIRTGINGHEKVYRRRWGFTSRGDNELRLRL